MVNPVQHSSLPIHEDGVKLPPECMPVRVAQVAFKIFGYVGVPLIMVACPHMHHCFTCADRWGIAGIYVYASQKYRRTQNRLNKKFESTRLYPTYCDVIEGRKVSSMEEAHKALKAHFPHDQKRFEQTFPHILATRRVIDERRADHIPLEIDVYGENPTNPSTIYHLQRPEPPKGRIGFINGIRTPFTWSCKSALYTSLLADGYNVHGVHNTTENALADLEEARLGKNGEISPPVWHLQQMWDEYLDANPEGEYLMVCHSQGAIHTFNALQHYPEEKRNRITVISVAGAHHIPDHLCREVHEFVSERDFVNLVRDTTEGAERVEIDGLVAHSYSNFFGPVQEKIQEFLTRNEGNAVG